MSERTFDDFDDFADDYRLIHTKNIKVSGVDSMHFAEMKVRLLKPFENNGNLEVLDIGCGDGATQIFMQQYFPSWRVTGLDISEKSIHAARQRKLQQAGFLVYNGTEIPFADEHADVVFIAGVLHHVDIALHQVILKDISRVLKRGGRLYVFEHNPNNPLTRHLVNTCVFDKDARLLKSNYTVKMLRRQGFKIHCRQFIIFFPRKGFFSRFIFLEKYLQWMPLGGQYYIRAIK